MAIMSIQDGKQNGKCMANILNKATVESIPCLIKDVDI